MTKKIFIIAALIPSLLGFAGNKTQEPIFKNLKDAPAISVEMVRLGITDLSKRFRKYYPNGKKFLAELKKIEKMSGNDQKQALYQLQHTAMLENPLLKQFKEILVIRREYDPATARKIVYTAQPSMNTYSLEAVNPRSGKDDIVKISSFSKSPQIKSFYKPKLGGIISEIDLNFDAKRLLYSGLGSENNWHLHEIGIDGSYKGQLTPGQKDINSFDSCYLPDERIIFTSTAPDQGLPCEAGRVRMANTFILDRKTNNIRRLTFDQDTNWGPTMMEDGRVMYMRWEYSDQAHYFSRYIMTMNPDGTAQKTHYGSNGYWPNSYGRIKPIPGDSSKFIATLGGHHSGRPGPLCLFDIKKGRTEEKGAVQMIPGYNKKIDPIIQDHLYSGVYPKFQNPFPLGKNKKSGAGTFFLVACKPTRTALWGIYLVDKFDNIVKIIEKENFAFNEPVPLMKTKRPPVIPDRIKLGDKETTVFIADIYEGPALKNIPRGKVKSLRLLTYHYSYYKSGSHEVIGCEASWDVKRILGTVPVEKDGSVIFKAQANTPISLQPLDENGAAITLMRSWFVGMPGEVVACIGCHEDQNQTVPMKKSNIASKRKPHRIRPWLGKERNFGFMKEVQPLLNRNCIACHNEKTTKTTADGSKIPDFKTLRLEELIYEDMYKTKGNARGGPFAVSYNNLNPYVNRPGPESNNRLLNPMEFHANTSILIQKLRQGHHGVKLTKHEWEKLYTWIDFNVPFWGSYTDAHRQWSNTLNRTWAGCGSTNEAQLKNIEKYRKRRMVVQKEYANIDIDYEADQYSMKQAAADLAKIKPIVNRKAKVAPRPKLANWPRKVTLGTKVTIKAPGGDISFRKIESGKFIQGGAFGKSAKVKSVGKSIYFAEFEVTNALYNAFDKSHSSRFMDHLGKDQKNPGIDVRSPKLPVIRISYNEAAAYAKWLSKKMGKKFRLPTETEWEYAACAGTDTAFYWGDTKADFSKYANLSDKTMYKFNARQTLNYYLRINSSNDGAQVQTTPGKYKPNDFGLYDMIGNVREWTSTPSDRKGRRVTKGGSWQELPRWTPVSARVPYQSYQKVFNVGFRLVLEQ